MKRWYYFVLSAVLIGGLVYVYLHWQELGLAGFHPAGTDDSSNPALATAGVHPATITWQKVDRTPDGFKVEMPIDVKDIQIPAYNERGGSEQVDMIYSNPSADTTFSVAWADNPPVARVNNRAPNQTLDMAREDAMARTQTTLVNESQAGFQGFPARDFAAQNVGGGILNSRLIYAGSRLYMLIAVFPSASARRERDVTRFFNSFIVTSSPGAPNSAHGS